MGQRQREIGHFEEKGAKALDVSVDTPCATKAWTQDRDIEFPLLSDLRREVIEDYSVKHEAGFSERAYSVIDEEGLVRAKKVEPYPGVQPEGEAVLEDLEKAL
jgi:peroxiredoxin (alkyl hydroperoxide reductase subunit C)